jgi:hypothetical protein
MASPSDIALKAAYDGNLRLLKSKRPLPLSLSLVPNTRAAR